MKLPLKVLLVFQAEFGEKKIHLNSRFPGAERLPNTCNFSFRGPRLQGDDHLPPGLSMGWQAQAGLGCRVTGRGTEGPKGPTAPRADSGGCPIQVAWAPALSLPESLCVALRPGPGTAQAPTAMRPPKAAREGGKINLASDELVRRCSIGFGEEEAAALKPS